jgi:multidrug resistance efflux pump
MMKMLIKTSVFLLSALSFGALASSNCSGLAGCERKFCELEGQIEQARESGHTHRLAGLTKALRAARQSCTDEGLRRELADDIRNSEGELADYRADLKAARAAGKQDKVDKYQRKIREEQDELKRLRRQQAGFE